MPELFADRYGLEHPLGAGGMSTVRLAFDTRLERYVAVKLLAEHLAHDSAFVARFRREALAAARLVHPNVVQVYDFGLDESTGRQYIVMEYVDGESCAEMLRDRGAIEPHRAVDLLAQACRGLDYAHRHGVIHRDVKPGNLLVNRDNQLKLADFGIAKAAEQSDITKVGSVLGTAAYLSPEQTRGEPAGRASDVYALGVVAYQALTGRLPYDGKSLPELARQQEAGAPVSPDLLAAGVPPTLAAAVLKALAPRPQMRYATATDMEVALRDGLRGLQALGSSDQTVALGVDDTTRMLRDQTAATSPMPPRRRPPLQPLREEPRPAPVVAEPARSPKRSRAERNERPRRQRLAPPVVAAPAPAPPKRRRGFFSTLRRLVTLTLLLALVVGGFMAYQAISQTAERTQRLEEKIRGDVNQAVNEIEALIDSSLAQ